MPTHRFASLVSWILAAVGGAALYQESREVTSLGLAFGLVVLGAFAGVAVLSLTYQQTQLDFTPGYGVQSRARVLRNASLIGGVLALAVRIDGERLIGFTPLLAGLALGAGWILVRLEHEPPGRR